jgi:hypothetical protein
VSTAQVWVDGLVTLGLWSWLIDRDNPIFEFCQYLYIGLSFAYAIALQYANYLRPVLIKIEGGQLAYIIPIILGLMIYGRYFKGLDFLGRWSLSFFVGYGAGYVLAFTPAVFLGQLSGSFLKLWGTKTAAAAINDWILLITLLAAIGYFFFTVSRERGLMKPTSALGRYIIMIGLGAGFGATILYRYSLLFGRVYFVFHNWLHLV